MIYRAKAPLRLGFGGGGTDVPPFSDEYGGYVLNATINKYVYVTLSVNNSDEISIHSQDYKQSISYNGKGELPYDGNLDLVKAVINRIKKIAPNRVINGCEIYIRSDAPPGVGLGTSSTAVVAVLGVFLEALNLHLSAYEIANLAWEIERKDMNLSGGKQDQYASSIGGVNFMEFHQNGEVIVNSLRLSKSVINELQYNLLLCYTGMRHKSEDIIKEQILLTKKRLNELEHLKMVAIAMKEDLITEDLTNFGNLLSTDWQHKKSLSPKISNKKIEELAKKANDAGAEGLKITGAGGGGVFIIYCDWKKKPQIADVMTKNGCQIFDFTITKTGLETWTTKNKGN